MRSMRHTSKSRFPSRLLLGVLICAPLFSQQEVSFVNSVHSSLTYFRVPHSRELTAFQEGEHNNSILEITLKSRRNNFEEMLILGFSCVGKVMQRETARWSESEEPPALPSIVMVHCDIPLGRNRSSLAASSNGALVVKFVEGSITARQFWWEISNSFEYASDFGVRSGEPAILNTDVDFENLVAARIAMESKNNPRVSNLVGMASKASFIPGVKGRLEAVLMDYMKSNHSALMKEVIGKSPTEGEMSRIGKLVFFHVQQPLDEIIDAHTGDSLKYVWGGRHYPRPLDRYYDDYYEETKLPRPRRQDR